MVKVRRGTGTVDIEDCTGVLAAFHAEFAIAMENMDVLADGGYVDEARGRIALYAKYLRKGYPIPTDHFVRLCDWLDRIAAGEDPATVFGTTRRRSGNPPSIETLEELDRIAQTIWALNGGTANSPKLPIYPNKKSDGAIAKAATIYGVSEAKAKQAWEVYGKSYGTLERTWQQGPPNLAPLQRAKGRRKA